MAALEIPGNGETGNYVSQESIQRTIDSLEDPLQKVGITTFVLEINFKPLLTGIRNRKNSFYSFVSGFYSEMSGD